MRIWIAIGDGSGHLTRSICRWIAGGAALRITLVFLAAGFIKGLPWTTAIAYTAAGAWLITAITLGLHPPEPTTEKTKEEAKDGTGEEDQEEEAEEVAHPADTLTRDDVAALLRTLLQETGGVHLATLATALPGPARATRDARTLLTRHGIRVRAGVRVPDVGPREGVHRNDIPPHPSPTPGTTPDGVVTAGQSNNNNGNNTVTEHQGGLTVISTPDHHNPVRTHVQVIHAEAGHTATEATR
jgi:hypothetical protein